MDPPCLSSSTVIQIVISTTANGFISNKKAKAGIINFKYFVILMTITTREMARKIHGLSE